MTKSLFPNIPKVQSAGIPEGMLDARALLERGWSRYMIRTIMPEPDLINQNEKRYYKPARVGLLEKRTDVREQLDAHLLIRTNTEQAKLGGPRPQDPRPELSPDELKRRRTEWEETHPTPAEPLLEYEEIKARGWPKSLIREILDEPDHRPWTGGVYYFSARVEALEKVTSVSIRISHKREQMATAQAVLKENLTPEARLLRQKGRRTRHDHERLARRAEDRRTEQVIRQTTQDLRESRPVLVEAPDYAQLMSRKPEKGGPIWTP